MSHSSLHLHRASTPAFIPSLFFIILLGAAQPVCLLAQWSTNPLVNTAICTATDNQSDVQVINNGTDGAIFAWHDYRNGTTADIYAQCIDAFGILQWKIDGAAICTAPNDQLLPQLASDGAGGAFITWEDYRTGTFSDIYAQHVNAKGVPQWAANGVAICAARYNQWHAQIVSDGSHGAIIAWTDYRDIFPDVYAQRINAAGILQWTASGLPICTNPGDQSGPQIVSDAAGGAIIAWNDCRDTISFNDIYAQRVDPLGTALWTPDGIPICNAKDAQSSFDMARDGEGGALLAWEDARANTYDDIYAQRVNKNGIVQWTPNGVPVCTTPNIQRYLQLTDDAAGGAIIAWSDTRGDGDWDIYAQHVSASGNFLWTTDGIPICTAPMSQLSPQIIRDDAAGAIIAWKDYRESEEKGNRTDIFAQHVNGDGMLRWSVDGAAVCTKPQFQKMTQMVRTSGGGAILAWIGGLNGASTDVLAQNIDPYGSLGFPPVITDVKDAAKDHGGIVDLSWDRSFLDTRPEKAIKEYIIYRGVPASRADATSPILKNGKAGERKHQKPGEGAYITNGATTGSGEPIYWEKLSSVRAKQNEHYSRDAETLSDSGAGGNARYYFMVRAYNATDIFWDSQPDSGYSVDNKKQGGKHSESIEQTVLEMKAPAAPTAYALEQNYPNPFNPTTHIRYSIPVATHVTLEIFNAAGVRIALLIEGNEEAGYKSVAFNAEGYPSGVYFYRLKAGTFIETKKLIVLH